MEDKDKSSSDKKHNISLRLVLFFLFCCRFAGSPQFSLSTLKQTKLFHFFNEKRLFEANFSPGMCVKRRSASYKKRLEFWRETNTPLWLLIGRIIFLTCEKSLVRDSDWTYHFFSRVKTIVHSSDWLEFTCVSKFTTQLFGEYFSVCI